MDNNALLDGTNRSITMPQNLCRFKSSKSCPLASVIVVLSCLFVSTLEDTRDTRRLRRPWEQGVRLRGAPIGIEAELIWLTWAAKTLPLSRSVQRGIPPPAIAPIARPPNFQIQHHLRSQTFPPLNYHSPPSTLLPAAATGLIRQRQSPTVKMAAFIKAINAKIRSNKYTDYICSTRT